MIAAVILPVVRRAILDFLEETGGEHNDDVLTMQLVAIGNRVARRDIREQLVWLGEKGMLNVEELGPYVAVTITPNGVDVANGRLNEEGIHRHKTGQ